MKPLVRSTNAKSMKNAVATAIACSVLLFLPGCKFIPQLRPAIQGPCLPDSFNGATSPDNSALIGSADFFNDPKLVSLINQAMMGNQNLKILAENVAIANNEVLRRRGAYLPFVTLGTGASLNKYSANTVEGADNLQDITPQGTNFPSPLPNFLVAGDVSWQVDIWKQLRNARDVQVFRYFGTAEGRNYAITRLIADIADNYYQLMALDKKLENLDRTIVLQEQSLQMSKAKKEFAKGTELAVQRFQAEVRRNQSEKLIIRQDIIETENRINFLVGRFPQPVDRDSGQFFDLSLPMLQVGVPADLLLNRRDIVQAERELAANGIDVRVARANFYPKLFITAGVGYEAYNTKYLFITPESLIYNAAGNLVAPLINRSAIKADYFNANARQLQAVYEYQRTVLNAFTEVINFISKVQNYSTSLGLKRQQLTSLEASVSAATNLFQNARVEYMDVLFAQRDLRDARMVYIETKQQQLSATVNAYQALGGGLAPNGFRLPPVTDEGEPLQTPAPEAVQPLEPLPKPVPQVPGPQDVENVQP